MPNIHKSRLTALAEEKARDASLLLEHGRYANAYYLAGYSVEIGLKAIIAGEFRNDTLPDRAFVNNVHTHRLNELTRLAGLTTVLKAKQMASRKFRSNWALVADWTEQMRYEDTEAVLAKAMVDAVCGDQDGVLQWLRTFW